MIKLNKEQEKREKRWAYERAYYLKNREKINAYNNSYRKEHPEKSRAYQKKYHTNNPEKNSEIQKAYRANNPNAQLAHVLRARIYNALKAQDATKLLKTIELLGCTISELHIHLEKQFIGGMSWEIQGEWHIDHIKPCVSFDLTDPEEQKKCFHYTNLQPLWAFDNLSKGARLVIR